MKDKNKAGKRFDLAVLSASDRSKFNRIMAKMPLAVCAVGSEMQDADDSDQLLQAIVEAFHGRADDGRKEWLYDDVPLPSDLAAFRKLIAQL